MKRTVDTLSTWIHERLAKPRSEQADTRLQAAAVSAVFCVLHAVVSNMSDAQILATLRQVAQSTVASRTATRSSRMSSEAWVESLTLASLVTRVAANEVLPLLKEE